MQRLHASDAQMFWMASKIPSDQFLLYCFDGATDSPDRLQHWLIRRAGTIEDLKLRIQEVPGNLDYPYWVPLQPSPSSVVIHRAPSLPWAACSAAVAELFADQLDPVVEPWRIHLFLDVTGAPRCHGPATVAVLQISHSLADGRRASGIARALFGTDHRRPAPSIRRRPPAVAAAAGVALLPWRILTTVTRSRRAAQLDDALDRAGALGLVPNPAPSRTKVQSNTRPDTTRDIRMIVCETSDLRPHGVSVTVGALTVISLALTRYLDSTGAEVPDRLGAEVTIARAGTAGLGTPGSSTAGSATELSRNNFHNAGVDLHPHIADLAARAEAIAGSLGERRARSRYPASVRASEARAAASDAVPAFLTRWGVRQFDADAVPESVTGNTVVSSVARGAADLVLGGAPVRFTAGFPGLSPVMGVTHGVHGIGATVTLSVTSSRSAWPEPEVYEAILREAIDDVRAGRPG